MLKEITIQNFKSIRDEIFFTMEADKDRVGEYNHHYININDNYILRTSSMYGPNGGGKSNIISAIYMLKAIVIGSGFTTPTTHIIKNIFSNDEIITETVFFINDKYEIGYNTKYKIQIINDTVYAPTPSFNHKPYFIYEEITYRKKGDSEYKTLLIRQENGSIISEELNKAGTNTKVKLSQGISVINHLFQTYADTTVKLVMSLDVIKSLWNEINSIIRIDTPRFISQDLLDIIKNNKDFIINILNNVDIKIKDINIYDSNTKSYPIYFTREITIDDNIIEKELPLIDESSGTARIFWMIIEFISSINKNSIFICDDMNSYLHPKLFREIINLFNSDYNKKSQLIFNSHDILNMDNKLFRRDEIWFVFRDNNYSTKVIPLSNIVNYKGEQVRKDAKYYKQYLEGKYGADPFIKKGFGWK